MPKHLLITIDVEAGPHLQSADHVARLIWGEFGKHRLGIGRMMDIAERYGRKLTFFLDFCETLQYPGAFERICREILAHGHDIQLHAHTQFLTESFWKERGLRQVHCGLDHYTRGHAEALMEFLVDCACSLGNKRPVAFRGGAFRYNSAILYAMARCRVPLSFNYNIKTRYQFNNHSNRGVFRWSNGIVEIPMSYTEIRGRMREFEFSSTSSTDFRDEELVRSYMEQFYSEFGNDAVLVMLMHSWSFLYREKQPGGFYFEFKDERLAENFEHFLAGLPEDVTVTTASQLNQLIEEGLFKIPGSRSIAEVDSVNQRIKAVACATLPAGALVAVISKGDDELLHLGGPRGCHFPEAPEGGYAGYHPADAMEAIAHLENVRSKGTRFLLVPAHSFWWLDHYGEFRLHLDQHYHRLLADDDCVIYDLGISAHGHPPAGKSRQ